MVTAGSFIVSLLKEKQELVHTVENQGNVAREMLDAAKSAIQNVPDELRENLSAAAEFFLERKI